MTEREIDEFLAQCPFTKEDLAAILLDTDTRLPGTIDLSNDEFAEFLINVRVWSYYVIWAGGLDLTSLTTELKNLKSDYSNSILAKLQNQIYSDYGDLVLKERTSTVARK